MAVPGDVRGGVGHVAGGDAEGAGEAEPDGHDAAALADEPGGSGVLPLAGGGVGGQADAGAAGQGCAALGERVAVPKHFALRRGLP